MLKFMRDHLGGTVLFVVVVLISLVFVLWGVFPESRLGRSLSAGGQVATVGGEAISLKDFRDAVERDIANYRALGMELPPELINQVRAGTLQNLVQGKLMLVEARRLGVQVSEGEIMEEIKAQPYFQDKATKAFDVGTYKKILAANGLSTGEFEQRVRDDLTARRLMNFLQARIRVTPQEVEREFRIANETRDLYFVRFAREDAMKKMQVTPAQVDEFLKKGDAQIASYYAANNARWNKAEQVCARHILKSFAPKGEAEANPPRAFLDLKPGTANFAQLAEKNSDDPGSKADGGDLKCFPRGQMDKAFEDVAFSTAEGKISAPVKSRFGWHYIYVYRKEPELKVGLEKVKREIAEELVKRERLDEIRKINLAAGDAALKSFPAKAESTGAFNSLEGQIPKIGRADEIMKAAFDPSAKIQNGPQLFEAQGGVIVARLKEKKSADLSKLEQEREKQLQTLKERKMRAFLPAWMEDVRKRTKVSINGGIAAEGM